MQLRAVGDLARRRMDETLQLLRRNYGVSTPLHSGKFVLFTRHHGHLDRDFGIVGGVSKNLCLRLRYGCLQESTLQIHRQQIGSSKGLYFSALVVFANQLFGGRIQGGEFVRASPEKCTS